MKNWLFSSEEDISIIIKSENEIIKANVNQINEIKNIK